MKKEDAKQKIEDEFINILAEQLGIEKDEEAKEILRDTVFEGKAG